MNKKTGLNLRRRAELQLSGGGDYLSFSPNSLYMRLNAMPR